MYIKGAGNEARKETPMRINTDQRRTLGQLMDMPHGCAAVSDWTNGSGRYTTRKATPPFCSEMPISDAMALPGLSGKQARAMHKARPRVKCIIIVTDRRNANKHRDQVAS